MAINDFGEHLGGARKDAWKSWIQLDLPPVAAFTSQPLSKTWPALDWDRLVREGTPATSVAVAHALRDALPRKPQSDYRVVNWSRRAHALAGLARALLSGTADPAVFQQQLKHHADPESVRLVALLYERCGHDLPLKGLEVRRVELRDPKGDPDAPPKHLFMARQLSVGGSPTLKDMGVPHHRNMTLTVASAETHEGLIQNLVSAIEQARKNSATAGRKKSAASDLPRYQLYTKRSEKGFYVGRKIGREVALLAGPFKDRLLAAQFMDENGDELRSLEARYREIPSERGSSNSVREGPLRRSTEVTPQMFQEAFGFRGVEFGLWVEQVLRQQNLNEAYDALMDMADVLGIPPKKLSLDGTLGLAFGARGTGGINAPNAHFEPEHFVMNLTKKRGPGALAHEWFHAYDNHRSRNAGRPYAYATEVVSLGGPPALAFPEPERARWKAAVRELEDNTDIVERSLQLDKRLSRSTWGLSSEIAARGFEQYIQTQLLQRGMRNDFLVNIQDKAEWDLMAKALVQGTSFAPLPYPYWPETELPALNRAFEAFVEQQIVPEMGAYKMEPVKPAQDDMLELMEEPPAGESPPESATESGPEPAHLHMPVMAPSSPPVLSTTMELQQANLFDELPPPRPRQDPAGQQPVTSRRPRP